MSSGKTMVNNKASDKNLRAEKKSSLATIAQVCCASCKHEHYFLNCQEFLAKSNSDRWSMIKAKRVVQTAYAKIILHPSTAHPNVYDVTRSIIQH